MLSAVVHRGVHEVLPATQYSLHLRRGVCPNLVFMSQAGRAARVRVGAFDRRGQPWMRSFACARSLGPEQRFRPKWNPDSKFIFGFEVTQLIIEGMYNNPG